MRPRPEGRGLRAGAALSPALLLLLLLLLLPPPPPSLLGALWAAGTPAPSVQDGAPGAGRVKRGWVWNQFFVVEEYTGTEPLYVGKVKWDPAPAILLLGPQRHPLADARDPSSLPPPPKSLLPPPSCPDGAGGPQDPHSARIPALHPSLDPLAFAS